MVNAYSDLQRGRTDTGKSVQSWSSTRTGEESIDLRELDDRVQSFSQDLLELSASKTNIPQFKTVRNCHLLFINFGFIEDREIRRKKNWSYGDPEQVGKTDGSKRRYNL